MATRSHQGEAGHHEVVVASLAYLHRADLGEPLGKGGGEIFRHVLNDYRARSVRRQALKHGLNGRRATG